MATSNSYNFSVSRDDIITDAMLYVGAIGEGETPAAAAVTEAARMLNMLMKSWAGEGMPLWALKRGYILPFTEASSISSGSHIVNSYETTTISADEASGQTQLSVTDTTGMANSDEIGIECDDGTMHWTTVSSVDSSTLVTIATALDDEASSGNRVYWYTASADRVQRPIRVFDLQIKNVADDTSYPINQVSRHEYFDLGDRTSTGTPNQLYHDVQLSNSTFYIYPRFSSGDQLIEFSYHRPFQDFDSSTDEPDCPQEFYLALTIGLSALLGPKYGIEVDERKVLMAEAKMYREEALQSIYPEGSIQIQPDTRGDMNG